MIDTISTTALSPELQEALEFIEGCCDAGVTAMPIGLRRQNIKNFYAAKALIVAALTPKAESVAVVPT